MQPIKDLFKKLAYLSFFLVEFIIVARETLHGNKKISQGGLEFLPIIACVEKFPNESLNLDLVQIREKGFYAFDKKIYHIFLVV